MEIRPRTLAILLSFIALVFFSSFPLAAKGEGKKQSQAIRITSQKMEARDQKGTVVFTGNVVAKRGDLTIYSDVLEVYYYQKSVQQAPKDARGVRQKLKKIVARGHLKIIQGRRKATAKEAVYYKPQEKIVLIKDARVWDGANTIKGDRITLFVNENRSIVESSGKDRVEAVVYPE